MMHPFIVTSFEFAGPSAFLLTSALILSRHTQITVAACS